MRSPASATPITNVIVAMFFDGFNAHNASMTLPAGAHEYFFVFNDGQCTDAERRRPAVVKGTTVSSRHLDRIQLCVGACPLAESPIGSPRPLDRMRPTAQDPRRNPAGGTRMEIVVFGRGSVGGGLADLWESSGHRVTRLGRDGGDASSADAVLVAVPGGTLVDSFDRLRGVEGKTVIDATNLIGARPPDGYDSNAEFVKARTNGPTAKSFNINFASLYGRLGEARVTPSNLWCGDEEARPVVELLNRDAGFEPVYAGPLGNAALVEGFIDLVFAINRGGMGPFLYRMAPPDGL